MSSARLMTLRNGVGRKADALIHATECSVAFLENPTSPRSDVQNQAENQTAKQAISIILVAGRKQESMKV